MDDTAPPKAPPSDAPQCGTHPGYHRHFRRNEYPCERCKAATVSYYGIRGRAQRRLAAEFPDRFAALLAEEEAKAAGDG